MKRFAVVASGLAGLAASTGVFATGIGGDANGYNVFIFGTGMFDSENTDTMGNLAAGGNVSLMNYSVAGGIAGNTALSPNPARLVVGGTLTATNGGVGSNQKGTIYSNNAANLTSFTTGGAVQPLSQSGVSSFANDATVYTNLSSSLDALAANGTATVSGSTLNITGTSSTLNVIDITGAQLSGASTVNISAPTGSTVLINVSGTSAGLVNAGVNETGVTDATLL
jgi:choice-of-anchor A domain-containing protein